MICGIGTRIRGRVCSGSAHGGRPCNGEESQAEVCNEAPCPGFLYEKGENIKENYSPAWTEWLQWSSCSQSCGLGMRERTRNCSIPQNNTTILQDNPNISENSTTITQVSTSSTGDTPSSDSNNFSTDLFAGDLDQSDTGESVKDSAEGSFEESEDLAQDLSDDSPSPIKTVEEPKKRSKRESVEASCLGEKKEIEDCLERKCPGH